MGKSSPKFESKLLRYVIDPFSNECSKNILIRRPVRRQTHKGHSKVNTPQKTNYQNETDLRSHGFVYIVYIYRLFLIFYSIFPKIKPCISHKDITISLWILSIEVFEIGYA